MGKPRQLNPHRSFVIRRCCRSAAAAIVLEDAIIIRLHVPSSVHVGDESAPGERLIRLNRFAFHNELVVVGMLAGLRMFTMDAIELLWEIEGEHAKVTVRHVLTTCAATRRGRRGG